MATFLASPLCPLLRQAAPRLSRRFFSSSCARRQQHIHSLSQSLSKTPNPFTSKKQTPFLSAFRQKSSSVETAGVQLAAGVTSSVGTSSSNVLFQSTTNSARGSEQHSQSAGRGVGYWLIGSAASVFGLVVFGGLTRLTESGLSITEWRPVTGSLPPFNNEDWEAEFARYKASPEYAQINPRMTLSEFKKIYWMEYTHRVWGRVVFFSFFIPTVYLLARRRVSWKLGRNLLAINALIVSQGFVGWWMVKSGLKDDLFAKGAHPRVSQYRLTVHLGLAFIVYLSMLWNGMTVMRENGIGRSLHAVIPSNKLRIFQRSTFALALLIFTTAMSGALVAGLDAGLIYNEFPSMGLGWVPPKSELLDTFYSRSAPPHDDLVWRNMLENPTFVQLDHRILAVSTFTAAHVLWAYARFSSIWKTLPIQGKRLVHGVLGLVWLQVTLGLTTLLYFVPLPAASAHQAGSMLLLTGVVALNHRLRPRGVHAVQNTVKTFQGAQAATKSFGKSIRNAGTGAQTISTST